MRRPDLQFLVFDDHGARYRRIEDAATLLRRTPPPIPIVIDWQPTVEVLLTLTPEALAEYDAIFVDFNLQSSQGLPRDERLRLDVAGSDDSMPSSRVSLDLRQATGMGVLLRVRELMSTPEYWDAWAVRASTGSRTERAWRDPRGSALYSFVEYADMTSRLFAAAAWAWFGARFFDGNSTVENMAQRLRSSRRTDAVGTMQQRMVELAAGPLMTMLTLNPLGDSQLITPAENPSGFDWYRIYRRAREGRHQFAFGRPIKEAFHEIVGYTPELPVRRSHQFDVIAEHLHDAAQTFIDVWDTPPDGSDPFSDAADTETRPRTRTGYKFSWTQRDPLTEFLTHTSRFWDAPDVRLAFTHHMATRPRTAGR